MLNSSQFPTVRGRKHVTDVLNAGQIHDAALKAETVARMAAAAVLAEVQIEAVSFLIHVEFFHAREQLLVVVLTLAAADNFADARDEQSIAATVLPSGFNFI